MLMKEVKAGKKLDAPYLKKKEDVFDGDIVQIVGDVEEVPDNFNPNEMKPYIKITTKNGDRWAPLNQTSINILISIFKTNDSAKWVGKEVKVLLKAGTYAGKKGYALYLAGKDWIIDEFGSPVKEGQEIEEEIPVIQEGEDIPTIQEDEDPGEVKIEDVPF